MKVRERERECVYEGEEGRGGERERLFVSVKEREGVREGVREKHSHIITLLLPSF